MGTPMELVTFDASDGKFAVNPEAAAILKRIPGPVAVVAVCGRARQGKSFLLNRLINSLTGSKSGFAVSPYQRPCTKGLWIYSSPIEVAPAGPGGRKFHLVLMDCEGIDAYDQTQQYSMQIFSLAVVLSSLFVYNQMGGIDESSLERLSVVSELTKRIWEKASSSAAGSGEGQFSPAFMWLLRDFHLQVEDEGRAMTPKDYLEETLQAMPGAQNQSRNQIRSSIKGLFPDRDCYSLVRPLTDEQQLARMDTLPLSRLRPEFQQGLQQLVDLIRVRARPKQYAGAVATGSMLAGLAEAFVTAINGGAVPVIANAWQGVVQGECYKAVEAAQAAYRAAFREAVDPDEAALDLEHQRALAAGMKVFAELSLGSPELVAPYEARYRDAVGARFAELRARRLAEADSGITAFLADATARVSQLLRDADALEASKLAALQREVTEILGRFERTARGPTKARRLQQFLQGTVLSGMESLIRRSVDATKQAQAGASKLRDELVEVRKQAAEAQQEARSSATRVSQLEADLAAARQQAQQRAAEVQAKAVEAATTASQLEAARASAERLSGELAEASRRETALRTELADAGRRVTQLTMEVAEKSHKGESTQAALEAHKAEAARLSVDLAAAQQRAVTAEGQLAAARTQLDTARADNAVARQAAGDAQQRADAHSAELARLQADVAAARQRAAEAEQRASESSSLAGRLQGEVAAAGVAAEQRAAEARGAQAAEVARLQGEMAMRVADAEERGRQEGRQRLLQVQQQQEQAERLVADLQLRLDGVSTELQRVQAQAAAAAAPAAAAGADEVVDRLGKRRRTGASADMEIDDDRAPDSCPEPSAPPLPTGLTPTAPASAAAAKSRPGRGHARKAGGASTSTTPAAKSAASRRAATPPPAPTPPAASPASAGLGSPMGPVAPGVPENPAGMSIGEIKVWLTDSGFEDDVYELIASKAKKADWLARIQQRISQL